MKTIITTIIFGISLSLSAQVGVGGKTTFTSSDALLDFGTETDDTAGNDAGGVVLLPTDALPASPVNGMIALVDDGTQTAFRYYENGAWNTISGGGATGVAVSGTDNANAQVIIGANTTAATGGVLVLESTDKALVLPQVPNGRFSLKPELGMMYYDTTDKVVYVYNGSAWEAF